MTYSSLKNVNQSVINFYPEYKELALGNDANNSNVRAYYGSDKKINELINYAKQRYNANLSFYATYGTTNTLPDGNVLENGTIPQKAVELGKGKLGCRYWWGQAGPTYFDCSGFVSWCYNTAGYNIGHQTTKTLIKMGKEVPKDRTQLQVGDLILSNSSGSGQPSHVTMYIGLSLIHI